MPIYKKSSQQQLPAWFNAQQVVDAAKETQAKVAKQEPLKKEAATKMVVVSYRDSKGHIVQADDKSIQAQLAEGKAPLDQWGKPLQIHRQIKVWAKPETMGIQSVAAVKEVSQRERQLIPSYVTDTVINRHLQYKAMQRLTDYANEMGMYGARARFLFGKNASMEGKDYIGFREVTAEITWLVGPRLNKHVTATIGIDPGDKFVLPKTFRDSDGNEHAFTKEAVASLIKGMQFERPSREVRKRSDIPQYRRPDPTNFNPIPKA